MSFQITITPNRRAAARFVTHVRRAILKAYAEEQKASGLTQTAIARALGVHRSVINRELKGLKDITLGRVAELAWAMGRTPTFDLPKSEHSAGSNLPQPVTLPAETQSTRGVVFLRQPTAAATTTSG
jgi:transcriptional regulator with XRE-family HTH domain